MCALPWLGSAPLVADLLSTRASEVYGVLSSPILDYLVFKASFCVFSLFFRPWNDKKVSFYRRLDLGLQNGQKGIFMLKSSLPTSRPQLPSTVAPRYCFLGLHCWRYSASLLPDFSAFNVSLPNRPIFPSIVISRPYTCKTTKLAENMQKNMHEKPKISIGD